MQYLRFLIFNFPCQPYSRLDRKGERIDARYDRAADKARANGRYGLADRLEQRGDRIEHRLDRKGDKINKRLDRKGDRINARLDRKGERMEKRWDQRHNRHTNGGGVARHPGKAHAKPSRR